MNKFSLFTVFVVGGSILCGLVAYAQEKTDGGGKAIAATRPSALQGMADDLKLTDEQQKKVGLILQEQN